MTNHTTELLVSQDLSGPWTLRWVSGPEDAPASVLNQQLIPATVPGQVHTDLMAIGLLDNPDVGFGEARQMWIGHSVWSYTRTFTWDPETTAGARSDLVADGLDTFASVRLNGTTIAHTADQHISYRWDVSERLVPGENVLEVTFTSAWDAAEEAEKFVGALPRPYDEPYPFVRKSACNFGWDWGPHYVTAGIWQPIRLESWSTARIRSVRPNVSLQNQNADAAVEVSVDLELDQPAVPEGLAVNAALVDPSGNTVAIHSTEAGSAPVELNLVVDDPQLWWPVGLGDQPLYELTVDLMKDGTCIDTQVRRIGIRSVTVDESPDSEGTSWALVVNGRRVRVRGYNWIPEDPFITEITAERLGQRLDQAVDGGANLLRVWGGGYFATEEFMAGCDERGLMVWHDFLFACSAYDESPAMINAVRSEAEQAVARLSSHPSLVMWCGGNECVWGMYDWGWPEILQGRPYGAKFYTGVLPEVVNRLNPATPYVPNSPWSGSIDIHPNDRKAGPVHIWEVWNDIDYAHYRDVNPAFVSEMGWCAPPAWTTLRGAVPDGELLPGNSAVVHHMRAADGMNKLARGLEPYFGAPTIAEDWHYLTQVVQARSQMVGVEWLRSRGRCAGVVIWQLNDCWPVLSWAAVDNNGIEKPVWYALQRSFAPELLTIQPIAPGGTQDPTGTGGLELIAVNDGLARWAAEITLRRMTLTGEEVGRTILTLETPPDSTARITLPESFSSKENGQNEFLIADSNGKRALWFFKPDPELDTPQPQFHATATKDEGSLTVTITANTLLRDFCLFPDRLAVELGLPGHALVVDTMLVTILSGETAQFRVSRRDGAPFDGGSNVEQVLQWPVLRSVGDNTAPNVVSRSPV